MTETIHRPSAPQTVHEIGLDLGLLQRLVLKAFYYSGNATALEIADRLTLPLGPTIEILDTLRKERLCEILGGETLSAPGKLRYTLTEGGLERALAALSQSGYAGPTPVRLTEYVDQVRRQSIRNVQLSRERIDECLSRLVLAPETAIRIGQALSSEKAVLLYGASGNGKTTAAENLRDILPGHILIPYAVEVMHEVIQVFDPATHEPVAPSGVESADGSVPADRRWVVIRRPAVFAAGELASSHLELIMDETNKTYEAPIQMKANGGLLVIDDFGRQHLDAAYLLNRWIVPLERGIDHLSLHNGARFNVPFDVVPLFLSNKQPSDLADEAFLRRIRYKVEIPSPSPDEFFEILRRECTRNGIACSKTAANYFVEVYFHKPGRQMRGCHPRDIVEAIADAARYQGTERALTPATIDYACSNYFV